MKCHAGVEFPAGAPCPKCKAKLGEVCWPGINADLLELPKLRAQLDEAKKIIQGVVTSYPVAAGTSKYGYEEDHDGYGSIRECRLFLEKCAFTQETGK